MKHKLTAYLLVTMLLSACFSFTGAALADPVTNFLIHSSPSSIKNGDQITFEVTGKNVQALYAFEAQFAFDTGKLEYVSSESAIEGFMVPAIVEGNHITIAATQKGNTAAQQGNIEICSLTFKAKQTGDAAVTLQTIKLLNAKLSETVYTVNGSETVSIKGTTTTPPSGTTSAAQNDKQISKDDSNTVHLIVKTNTSLLLQQLAGDDKQLTIDATSSETVGYVQIELTGEVIARAAELGKSILIQSNGVELQFDPSSFKVKNGDAVKLSWSMTERMQESSDELQQISGVFDFDLSVDGQPVHDFSKPLEVHFNVEASKIEDEDMVGVYYFNKDTKMWEYVGGTLTNDHTITADLDHFSPYAVLESDKTFSDIQAHWAQSSIEQMAAKQIVNGVSEQLFQPNATVTRAQFVSMIARALKLPAATTMGTFTDVSHSAWYMDSVYAANQADIIKGASATTFAPNAVITREQMAQIVVQAYLYATGGATPKPAATSAFSDETAISSWASDSVQIAVELKLIKGFTDGSFGPQLQATRAQAATIIKMLLDLMAK